MFAGYCTAQLLAICSALTLQLPSPLGFALLLGCLAHGAWVLPRQVLLTSAHAVTGLRRSPEGWALFNRAKGWQPAQLRRDSMALPGVVILRYRLPGQWWSRSVCIPADSLSRETHRRLRLRLRFSRKRFAAPL
nr:protein YgfX [Pseudomonas sp. RIT-PI-S]